jgi:hypothetical protein
MHPLQVDAALDEANQAALAALLSRLARPQPVGLGSFMQGNSATDDSTRGLQVGTTCYGGRALVGVLPFHCVGVETSRYKPT